MKYQVTFPLAFSRNYDPRQYLFSAGHHRRRDLQGDQA